MKAEVYAPANGPNEGFTELANIELVPLRALVVAEINRRGLASDVGQVAESLSLAFYNGTLSRPNLHAPRAKSDHRRHIEARRTASGNHRTR